MTQITKRAIEDNAVDGQKIRLNNNQNLKARNAANTADINILKVNASNEVELQTLPKFSGSSVATQSYAQGLITNLIPTSEKGSPNGVATLDASGLVPAEQLPSYVDDVLEFDNLASFPAIGEGGKIYVAVDTRKVYRWSGSAYIEISPNDVNSVNGKTGVVTLTTTDISEGTNQYYTTARFNSALATKTTDNLTEGLSNQYFTPARARTASVLNTMSGTETDQAPSVSSVKSYISSIPEPTYTASRALVSNATGNVAASTVTSTELGHLSGVTSAIQTQINSKQATITGAATTITSSNLTASRALVSNSSGKVEVSSVTSTELGRLSGVTSAVQTQIDSKQATITGAATTITSSDLATEKVVVSDLNGKISTANTTTQEVNHLSGVTSAVQTQLDARVLGPASATTLAIARFDGTTGKLIQSGTGTITTAGAVAGLTGLTSSGTVTFSGIVVNSSNTANTQTGANVNITNATTAVTRLTGAVTSIGGYANNTSGRRNIIINNSSSPVTILNEDLSTTEANRILTGTGGSINLEIGASIEIIYNTTMARWVVIGHAQPIYQPSKALATDPNGIPVASIVTSEELVHLSGVSSPLQDQINGKVNGPESATNLAIARFDGVTGKLIQSGTGTITTAGSMSGLTGISSSGSATFSGALNTTSTTTSTVTGSSQTVASATASVIRLTGAGLVSIGGYAGTTGGRRTIFINNTGNEITINNEDLSVTAANRIVTGTNDNVKIQSLGAFEILYNATTARNHVVGLPSAAATGGSGGGVEIFNNYIVMGSSASSLTGVNYFKAPSNLTISKVVVQLWEKGSVSSGTLSVDIKKNSTPSDTGMTSIFSILPSFNFATAADYATSSGTRSTSSVSDGEWLRLDVTSIPTGWVGKVSVMVYA